jgi:two-component system sensor histidine kinase PrrB
VRSLQSLRGRVALLATLAVAAVLLAVGAAAVASFADRERARVDESLEGRSLGALVRALGPFRHVAPGPPPDLRGPRVHGGELGPRALRTEGEYIRVVLGGDVVREVDAPAGLPVPREAGLTTLGANGDRYRSLTREARSGVLIEVGADLGPAEDRIASLRTRLLVLGGLGTVLVGGLSWWLAGLALRPLGRLREAAGRVSTTRDLSTRLPSDGAPEEVSELAASINSMLGRLERSASETDAALEATRRFAGDAGHELRTPMTALQANLGTLRRNPDLSPSDRRAALAGAEREAERAARLLEMLQTLARGDAGAALPRESVDLPALTESAVEAARSRHPDVTWHLKAPRGELRVTGWPDGLRALVDNLLENAARHGRPGGEVRTELAANGAALVLTVDDDGAGVEASERERIFERFRRGNGARTDGSGLGLALVRQQARLHGGEVSISDSPLGGARFRVSLADR